MSYVRGVLMDFFAAKIREVLKIRFLTPGAKTDFQTGQMEDQRLMRVEELITDNIAIVAEAAQGKSKLSFPRTIFRLCKEAGVSMAEFRGTKFIPVAKPITAKVMTTTRGRINNNNPPQDQHIEEDKEQWLHNDNDVENEFINHEEHEQPEADFEETYQHFAAPNNEFFNNFQDQRQQYFQ
ncbi:hypothetical protein PIB30_078059 [Stylosanthes scabra]|uniref:Uncharacterized protein n=1 Tax=Stylosanthes scabra TaxID=79078 RepID=A0ABU6SR39_9FABA|nr:hypothetical protein [Stylosanthes scabra]